MGELNIPGGGVIIKAEGKKFMDVDILSSSWFRVWASGLGCGVENFGGGLCMRDLTFLFRA